MKTYFWKRNWWGQWLIALLCILVLVPSMPENAAAQAPLAEYFLLQELIAALADILSAPAAQVLVKQLETSVQGAAAANAVGDTVMELSRLSKAIGATEALFGITSSCGSDCDQARSELQQIVGLAAVLRGNALGTVSGSCNPNGVIQGTEQCDPLAVPTGCPVLTLPSFCNDECQCQISPIP